MTDYPKRRRTRLQGFDYNTPGAYFITICTKNREEMLSEITVGTGVPDGPFFCIPEAPKNMLTQYGKIAEKHIIRMNDFYDNISVDKYVIMPNHIHLLIRITEDTNKAKTSEKTQGDGPSRTPVPTVNSVISRFVSTFKRFCNKEIGENIWQYRSNDHIIRNEKSYKKIWEYIETNPSRWKEDCFYIE